MRLIKTRLGRLRALLEDNDVPEHFTCAAEERLSQNTELRFRGVPTRDLLGGKTPLELEQNVATRGPKCRRGRPRTSTVGRHHVEPNVVLHQRLGVSEVDVRLR